MAEIYQDYLQMPVEALYNEVVRLCELSPATEKVGSLNDPGRGFYALRKFWEEMEELHKASTFPERLGELADILYYYAAANEVAKRTGFDFQDLLESAEKTLKVAVMTVARTFRQEWERAYILTIVKYKARQTKGKNTVAENKLLEEVYALVSR